MTSYDLRPARPGDEQAVRRLLGRAGSVRDLDPSPRNAETAGARAWVLALGNRVVGCCASRPSAVWIGGEQRTFAQVVLPALDPQHRAAIEGEGAHERLAARVVESTFTPAGDLALQALVHEDDWRAFERLFGLEIVRTQSILRFELDDALRAAAPFPPESARVVELTDFGEETRWLWDRCAAGFGASAIRTPSFLAERFADERGARLLGLRDGQGVLRGHAAYHTGAGPAGPCGTLVEWLVPPAEPEVGARLLAACGQRARAAGARELTAILPGWSPWFAAFQAWGALVGPSPWLAAARTQVSRFDTFWLRDSWWYQPADFLGGGADPRCWAPC